MWFHFKELWDSSRTLQITFLVAILGVIFVVLSPHQSPGLPARSDSQSVLKQSAEAAGQHLKKKAGVPDLSVVPGKVQGTVEKAAGVVDESIDVAGKAVDVADTAVEVGKDVVDTGAAVANRLLPTRRTRPSRTPGTPNTQATNPLPGAPKN